MDVSTDLNGAHVDQLALNLAVKLRYDAEHFVLHGGVKELHDALIRRVQSEPSSAAWVVGPARSGKTHFAIRLSDTIAKAGFLPRIIDGVQLEHALVDDGVKQGYVTIVDDADRYFSQVLPGSSGPFVSFWEKCRQRGAHIIFLSTSLTDALPCDEHAMSRLAASAGYELLVPAEEDIDALLDSMSRQRGLNLSEVKRDFLTRRLRRDVPSLEEYLDRLLISGTVSPKVLSFQNLNDVL